MRRPSVDEQREAYRAGLRRSKAARSRSGAHRYRWSPEHNEQRDVDGQSAVAEFLVACALGRQWTSDGVVPDAPHAGDVEGGVSVRWTARANGCLIVHEDEPADLVAVLVVRRAPEGEIKGWIKVRDAQHPNYWRGDVRHPAFFVPQSALRDIVELR